MVASLTGEEGDNGWYIGDVKVTWSLTDATSGFASGTQCDAADVTEDTTGTSYTCSATDLAGNTSSDSVTVKRDATAPTVDPKVVGMLGTNGWYVGDVTVGWSLYGRHLGRRAGRRPASTRRSPRTPLTQHFTCTVTRPGGQRHRERR